MTKEQFMETSDRAPEGQLKWLLDESPETIPHVDGLYYELTYDDEGRIFPTVVLRDEDNAPIGGVQLGYEDLLEFARWGMQNGLALLNIRLSPMRQLTVADASVKNHLREHLADLLKFVQEQLPEPFEELIEASVQNVITKRVNERLRRVERDVEDRVRASLARERKDLEQRHAQHIVQLSKIATLSSPVEQGEALDDPILQSVVLKAVNTLADAKRA